MDHHAGDRADMAPERLAQRHRALAALNRLVRRLNADLDLAATLDAVVRGVVDGLGFRVAVVNLVREDGDLEVVAVAGSEEARAALMGQRCSRRDWDALLEAAEAWGELRYLDHARARAVGDAVPVWTPPSSAAGDDAEAWKPEDELLAPLVSPREGLTGVLSVDLPVSGRRPDADQRELLEMYAAQAQLAIENARLLAAVEATRRADLEAQARRLEALVAAAPVGIVELDPEGRIRTWNPAAERIYGQAGESVLGRPAAEVGSEDASVGEVLEQLGKWKVLDRHLVHRQREGSAAEVELSTALVPQAGQPRAGVLGVLTDVTERHRLEEKLQARAAQQAVVAGIGQQALGGAPLPRLLRAAVRAVADTLGVRLVSVLELVQGGARLRVRAGTGWPEGYVGQHHFALDAMTPATLALRSGGPVVVDDLSVEPGTADARDCMARGARASACVLIGEEPWGVLAAHAESAGGFSHEDLDFLQSVANVIGTAVERHRVEAATRHQALHDALTGLPNRALLTERVERAISSARQGRGGVGLVLLDLDGFKDVNDALGHDGGDLLLCQVARRLSRCLRRGDTLARLGGDEFAACLRLHRAGGDAEAVARRLGEAFAEPFHLEGSSFRLTASMGMAQYPGHGTTCPELLRRADLAMYRAKASHSGLTSYDSERDESPAARLPLSNALRRGLESDQLSLHYQPVIELSTGGLSHVEALVRWRHPTLGLVPPDHFIPLAEQTGLIRSVTTWVLREAARQAAAWAGEGWDLPIAVNLSAVDLEDPQLVAEIEAVARDAGIPASLLSVEVTESALAQPEAHVALSRLASAGILAAVDDFGTGYSSLAYLKRLPLCRLKIDREFVTHMNTDDTDRLIVRAVLDLARGLGLEVVAEGIEDAEVTSLLRWLGVPLAQGYHFARPMSPARLRRWLRARGEPMVLPRPVPALAVAGAGSGRS